MSSPERRARSGDGSFRIAAAAALVALATTSACTVRPLYGDHAAAGEQAGASALLSSIAIKPVDTRYAQEVRNHLIFLFSGGAGEPEQALYSLELGVISHTQAGAIQQVAGEDEPTAGTVTLSSTYRLTRAGTGEEVVSGSRRVASSFDRPSQLFAAERAERDAQNRAARELAELIRLAIAQALEAASRAD